MVLAHSATRHSGDVVADIVADIVSATRHGTVIYSRNRFHAPWGISTPPLRMASFHVVTQGACWLVPDDGDPIQLTRGDAVLVPSGIGHALVDTPGRPTRPLTDYLDGPLGQAPAEVVIEGPGPVTGLLCGGYVLDPGPRHPFTAALPAVVHVGAGHGRRTGLAAAVDLLSQELDRGDPGGPAVIGSLVELLFVYVLRAWLAEQGPRSAGWARALHDPIVGAALALIHRQPGQAWTVTSLARAVGTPRATFGRRFTALAGQAPMTYVTAWRMTVAARLLREERLPLKEVASRVGYDSEFAFGRAFKRATGQAPGRYRTSVARPVAVGLDGS